MRWWKVFESMFSYGRPGCRAKKSQDTMTSEKYIWPKAGQAQTEGGGQKFGM